jgi:hypothetical protein
MAACFTSASRVCYISECIDRPGFSGGSSYWELVLEHEHPPRWAQNRLPAAARLLCWLGPATPRSGGVGYRTSALMESTAFRCANWAAGMRSVEIARHSRSVGRKSTGARLCASSERESCARVAW